MDKNYEDNYVGKWYEVSILDYKIGTSQILRCLRTPWDIIELQI